MDMRIDKTIEVRPGAAAPPENASESPAGRDGRGFRLGIRGKVVLFLTLLVVVLIAAQTAFLTSSLQGNLRQQFTQKGYAIAVGLEGLTTDLIAADNLSLLQTRVDDLAGIDGVAYITVRDPEGSVLVHTFAPAVPTEIAAMGTPAEAAMTETDDGSPMTLSELRYHDLETGSARNALQLTQPVLGGLIGYVSVGMDLDQITAVAATAARRQAAIFALLGLVAIGLGFLFAQRLLEPIRALLRVSERVGRGDLAHLVPVLSRDELGDLSETMNATIRRLRGMVQTEEERDEERRHREALQGNIGAFLDVAMDIAEGDFTQRGQVSDDVLGNVVDAINLMVEELGALLRQVRDAALQVNDGADTMVATTDAIATSALRQGESAATASREVGAVTASIRKMAENADRSADAAARTLDASQQGAKAVEDTLEGMQGIRREVQGVAKRIKSLGDRSLEISEIVETISGIASQTNLLALNAAIEAAGAGQAGSRFATVADEVRRLAEDSAAATQRIAALIKNVQAEVQEVTASVEDGTREVEAGYRVANEAGERLREISAIAQESAQLAQIISQATQKQVGGAEMVGRRVRQMAGVAEGAQASAQQGREAAERLRQLSEQLTGNLARFRLEG